MNLLKRSGVLLAVNLVAFIQAGTAATPKGKGNAARGKAVFQISGWMPQYR
jgi:hypothetical protein